MGYTSYLNLIVLIKTLCFAQQEKGMLPTFWLVGKDPSLTTETE